MARAVHKVNDAGCHYAGGTTSELGTPSAPADSEGKDGALHIIEGAGRDKGLGDASTALECFCVVNLKQVGQPGHQHHGGQGDQRGGPGRPRGQPQQPDEHGEGDGGEQGCNDDEHGLAYHATG